MSLRRYVTLTPLRRFIKRRLLPQSLFGRALLIIVSPLILLQIVSVFIFYDRHWETVTRRLTNSLAGDISLIIEEMKRDMRPENQRHLFHLADRHFQLNLSFKPDAALKNTTYTASGALARNLARALDESAARPYRIDTESRPHEVIIDIETFGGILHVIAPRERLFSSTTYIFILWMVGTSVALFAVASIFMRNQVRPIRRLGLAADRFGKGRNIGGDIKVEGATEVRQAATAFNRMRERILRQIRQRTDMLAGVSHDLRTPLTRMKLQLAMLDELPEVQDLRADVSEMEKMIEGYLTFARGEGGEGVEQTNVSDLVEQAASAWQRNGAAVDCHVESQLVMLLKPNAVRRCLDNLVANGTRYGKHVWLRAGRRGETIEITVDDDGPGIPEAERENVFRAFYRLDSSRNPGTGGSGLGLAIARDVARNHGGDVVLESSPHGGLRARLRLPI